MRDEPRPLVAAARGPPPPFYGLVLPSISDPGKTVENPLLAVLLLFGVLISGSGELRLRCACPGGIVGET